jgi:hypothetical protein
MSTLANPEFDLSRLPTWRGLRPGLPRAEVSKILERTGRQEAENPSDPESLAVDEWGTELQSDEEGDQRLRQIELDDEQYHWNGRAVLGQPLHLALEAFGDAAREAGWRPENAVDSLLDDLEPIDPGPYHDQHLLDHGTLWLPVVRIGLVMQHGLVQELVWRDAADIPRQTVSPVTEAQLAISRRADLQSYLRFWRPERRMNNVQRILTGAFVLAVIGIGVFAFQLQQHWSAAPAAKARVTALKIATNSAYDVEFTDTDGKSQTATLHARDFYVPPSEVGQEVEIRYLPTEPIQVRGPARAQDSAFVTCFPWAIAATGIYGVLFWLAGRRDRARMV